VKPGDLIRLKEFTFLGFPNTGHALWSTDGERKHLGYMNVCDLALVLTSYEFHSKILLKGGTYMISHTDVVVVR